jgi:hypothetical protein
MNIGRRELIKTALASACLQAFRVPAFGASTSPVEVYAQRAQRLVAQHRRNVGRMTAPAEVVAEALIAGHGLKLSGPDKGWVSEGLGRAGGPMVTGNLAPDAAGTAGDVVWLSYNAGTYDSQVKRAAELESQQCKVMAFGPRPASGAPEFHNWIDSLTPWGADDNFALLGNVMSLWTLTGEVAAATARKGKTMVFWQSIWMEVLHPAMKGRNERYRGHTFHAAGEPQMKPVAAGVAGGAYLDAVRKMLHEIQTQEMDKIVAVGKEVARRSAARPVTIAIMSHMMHDELRDNGKLFTDYKGDNDHLAEALGSNGYLVYLGYYDGVSKGMWDAVRKANAKAVWVIVPVPSQKYNFELNGDVVINQHYEEGDAAVKMPGYDVQILPPSGISQLFVYELMIRAAGNVS